VCELITKEYLVGYLVKYLVENSFLTKYFSQYYKKKGQINVPFFTCLFEFYRREIEILNL